MPNPGSYNEYVQEHGLEAGPGAAESHSTELRRFREELAADQGITVDELHRTPWVAAALAIEQASVA